MTSRLLYVTHTTPLPAVSGERLRSFNLLRQLSQHGWSVTLVSLASSPSPSPADQRALERLCTAVYVEPLPPRSARLARVARDVLLRRALHRSYFHSFAAQSRVRELLHDGYDVIVAAQLYVASALPSHLRSTLVFDSVNVEARRLEAMTALGLTSARRLVARLQRAPVQRYESQVAMRADLVLAVSELEARYLDRIAPGRTHVVPNGVDITLYAPRSAPPAERTVLFVGSFDYGANVDAVEFFLREIAPSVDRAAHLRIVGSSPPRSLTRLAQRARISAEVTGFVERTAPEFTRARVLVVPLRSGGGTRLKILEALASGLPVVSTRIGAEGLGLIHGEDVLIADDPREFAALTNELLDDETLWRHLSSNGRHTVERHFTWDSIGARLDGILRTSRTSGSP